MAIKLKDTQALVVGLLTSLWTADSSFAGHVLNKMFGTNSEGEFCWPEER